MPAQQKREHVFQPEEHEYTCNTWCTISSLADAPYQSTATFCSDGIWSSLNLSILKGCQLLTDATTDILTYASSCLSLNICLSSFVFTEQRLYCYSPPGCEGESLIQFTKLHFYKVNKNTQVLQHFISQKALFVISVSFYFCRVWASLTSRAQAWTVAEDASATQRKAVGWVSVSSLPDLGPPTPAHHGL